MKTRDFAKSNMFTNTQQLSCTRFNRISESINSKASAIYRISFSGLNIA